MQIIYLGSSNSDNKKTMKRKIDTDFDIENLINKSNFVGNKPSLVELPENRPNSLSNSNKRIKNVNLGKSDVYANSAII